MQKPSNVQLTIKRGFDLCVSFLAIIAAIPILVVVAAVVYWSSGRPIFFRQIRVGKNLRPFSIIKFRTMTVNDEVESLKVTAADDSRITPVGRVLRRSKLDELPQLWNILIGDMSFVGPRPEVPEYVEKFESEFSLVLSMRPGLTDWASIRYRNENSLLSSDRSPSDFYVAVILPDKIRLAKSYVLNFSLFTDIKILLTTCVALFFVDTITPATEFSDTRGDSVRKVPYHRPLLADDEINEVCDTLRSGWLTTGPKTKRFEEEFATYVHADHALAVNSCTAALHLAVEALGLRRNQAVLVPTFTFAATAEVVRYCDATPLLVDCNPHTFNIDLEHAEGVIRAIRSGQTVHPQDLEIVGIMPVHVGGLMCDMDEVKDFSERHGLWVVEDAAHALPAAFRNSQQPSWRYAGNGTADVTCFSFYANKTITTGEGGMAVTNHPHLASRMRQMALHGLSNDAWKRFSGGNWDYKIIAPGFKYNLTDVASAIGVHQLRKADDFRRQREYIAYQYIDQLKDNPLFQMPEARHRNRIHSWHLFPISVHGSGQLRNELIDQLKDRGVGTSVHWRPLHLHPYYSSNPQSLVCELPHSTGAWERLISLPIYPSMTTDDIDYVVAQLDQLARSVCNRYSAA